MWTLLYSGKSFEQTKNAFSVMKWVLSPWFPVRQKTCPPFTKQSFFPKAAHLFILQVPNIPAGGPQRQMQGERHQQVKEGNTSAFTGSQHSVQ